MVRAGHACAIEMRRRDEEHVSLIYMKLLHCPWWLFGHMSDGLYTCFALSGWRLLIANKRNHACISCLVLLLLTCIQDMVLAWHATDRWYIDQGQLRHPLCHTFATSGQILCKRLFFFKMAKVRNLAFWQWLHLNPKPRQCTWESVKSGVGPSEPTDCRVGWRMLMEDSNVSTIRRSIQPGSGQVWELDTWLR